MPLIYVCCGLLSVKQYILGTTLVSSNTVFSFVSLRENLFFWFNDFFKKEHVPFIYEIQYLKFYL